jgi:hypothetical protein
MDIGFHMVSKIDELQKRVDKIEEQRDQEVLTLIEILSNATFFGEMKKANCDYAKEGQCSFFVLKSETKNKIPIATECRVEECEESTLHCHLELSNITCSLCQITNSPRVIGLPHKATRKTENMLRTHDKGKRNR